MKKGNYFGTEIGGKWWRRYRASTFFARGNGEFWFDEEGIHFLRAMTKKPLTIEWPEVGSATLGRAHAGRWAMGRPVLKIAFSRDGEELVAGFYLSREWDDMSKLADNLNAKVSD